MMMATKELSRLHYQITGNSCDKLLCRKLFALNIDGKIKIASDGGFACFPSLSAEEKLAG